MKMTSPPTARWAVVEGRHEEDAVPDEAVVELPVTLLGSAFAGAGHFAAAGHDRAEDILRADRNDRHPARRPRGEVHHAHKAAPRDGAHRGQVAAHRVGDPGLRLDREIVDEDLVRA